MTITERVVACRSKLELALDHAKRGWPVLPLHFVNAKGRCSCGRPIGECKPGKHPLATPIFKNGFKDATLDIEVIKKTWAQYPKANIGWVLGRIIVIDQDNRHGGAEALTKLEAKHGPLPSTVTALTGSGDGSRHRYYLCPDGDALSNLNKVDGLEGLELKVNGYAVGVGSVTTKPYIWETGAAPDDLPIAPLPEWMVTLSRQPFKQQTASVADSPKKDKRDYPALSKSENTKALAKALSSCAFLQHCSKDATTLSEPEWQAMIELLVFFGEPGVEKIHELSSPYPTYSEAETNSKIANAARAIDEKGIGPYTCAKIQQSLGFTCPASCLARQLATHTPVTTAIKAITGAHPLPPTPVLDESSRVQTKSQESVTIGTTKVQEEGSMLNEKSRGATRRAWVKVYITGWLSGSIRWQLTPEERGVWADLICLAGLCGKEGRICDNDGKPYPLKYVANMLNIPESLLLRTIGKCKSENRLTEENGIISITNWKVYQSEYERLKGYRG